MAKRNTDRVTVTVDVKFLAILEKEGAKKSLKLPTFCAAILSEAASDFKLKEAA
jgi:hypothetical protein